MSHATKTEIPTAHRVGTIITARPHTIGEGFAARHFSEEMFDGRMDPLLMVDHFVMTEATFAPHLHAGISAVTMMFEDSVGGFRNRDTLGNNVTLEPGDLYWLTAASGAVHEELPEPDARTHALQIFVNLPAHLKKTPARALHVRSREIPILSGAGYRVRVVLGASGSTTGNGGTPEPMTILDGTLQDGAIFPHHLPAEQQAWIYAASGKLAICCGEETALLDEGHATTIEAGSAANITLTSEGVAHFVLMAAKPIRQPFVKHGPLVMSTSDDVRQTLANYASGRFGNIPT